MECSMQSEGNAECREKGPIMQSEGNAESYSGIASVPLSSVYYAQTANGNRGMQCAE